MQVSVEGDLQFLQEKLKLSFQACWWNSGPRSVSPLNWRALK